MHDNLVDEHKEHLKREDNKRKKEKPCSLNVDEKKTVEEIREKMKESYAWWFWWYAKRTFKNGGQQKKKENRDNLNLDEKEQLRK